MAELFLEVLNRSISASWLVLIIVAVRILLKNAPKWMAVVLWGLVALRLVSPFSLESTLSLIPSAETVPQEILLSPKPQIHTGIEVINSTVNPILAEQFSPEPVTSANPLQILIPILAFVWSIGMVGMALYTFVSYWKLRRRVRTAIHVSEELYLSEFVSTPFVLGLFRPRIYLPYHMTEQDSHYVVAHERTHIRRKDHWWKPMGFLLLTINWFNPLMWLAYILLCRDIELACDEKVIRDMGPGQRADYSQALLNCSVSRRSIAACPLAFGEVGVKDRVVNVLNYKKPTFWVILICVILIVLIAVCFLTDPKTTLPFMNNYTPVLQAEVFDSRSGEAVSRVLTMDEREELSYRLRDMDGLQERSAPTGSAAQYSLTAELMDLGNIYVRCAPDQEVLLQFQEKDYLVTDLDFVEYLDTVCAGKHIAAAPEIPPETLETLPQNADEKEVITKSVTTLDGYELEERAAIQEFAAASSVGIPLSLQRTLYRGEDIYRDDLRFDGSSYLLRCQEGEQIQERTYAYLLNFQDIEETASSRNVYDLYVLTNDSTLTWEQLSNSLLSSQSSDFIDFYLLYSEAIPLPEEPSNPQYLERPNSDSVCISIVPTEVGSSRYTVCQDQEAAIAAFQAAIAAAIPDSGWRNGDRPTGITVQYQGEYLFALKSGEMVSFSGRVSAADAAQIYAICMEAARNIGWKSAVWPEQIHGIQSATLSWYDTVTLLDPQELSQLEAMLSRSTVLYGGAGCPFGNLLTLELDGGETVTISIAADSCGAWLSNGVYFRFGNGNETLYRLFSSEIIHMVAQEGMDSLLNVLTYLNWGDYANTYGPEETMALMDQMREWAMEEPSLSRIQTILPLAIGLDGAYTDAFANVLGELYERNPKDFAWACLGNASDELEAEILALLSYNMGLPIEETRALLESNLP